MRKIAARVTLSGDGVVRFDGLADVAVRGRSTARIDPAAFEDLWRDLWAQPYDALPSEGRRTVHCASFDTDHPSLRVVVSGDGVERRVDDYRGCGGNDTLDDFRVLEDRIDSVANTRAWIED
jgi:hypothetical protein